MIQEVLLSVTVILMHLTGKSSGPSRSLQSATPSMNSEEILTKF